MLSGSVIHLCLNAGKYNTTMLNIAKYREEIKVKERESGKEFHQPLPLDIMLKSSNDFIQSILSGVLCEQPYNWLLCEGSSELVYFRHYFKDELMRKNEELKKEIEELEIETLLSGRYDKNNAIITLHPGAGGTESQDWVEMLYRMYGKWCNKNGFDLKELDYLEGDEAGIKSVTALISGENAYGYLKGEMGVHRLIRISPFDSGGRRHTSFASVEVLPEISDDMDIYINPDDLRIDTFRASRSRWTTHK